MEYRKGVLAVSIVLCIGRRSNWGLSLGVVRQGGQGIGAHDEGRYADSVNVFEHRQKWTCENEEGCARFAWAISLLSAVIVLSSLSLPPSIDCSSH